MKIPASHVKMGAQLAEQFPAFQAEFSIYGSFEKTSTRHSVCGISFILLPLLLAFPSWQPNKLQRLSLIQEFPECSSKDGQTIAKEVADIFD
ncbi:hypothetical protein BDR26DRAFT_944113 [Obelidium mucronatum]|nr:hypothetical protein BDR26DRAFT_944113 [Obelidium mucronatum]